mgnify:CR=1 FL=1
MTVIAVDQTSVAADGLDVCDGIIVGRNAEKIRVVNGFGIYAMTGVAPLWEPLIAWHCKGAKPEDVPKIAEGETWTFIAITKGGIHQYHENCAYPDRIEPPWAWGANNEIALGAMYAGKTAAEAVALVCERTINCGGKIQVVHMSEALGLTYKLKVRAG